MPTRIGLVAVDDLAAGAGTETIRTSLARHRGAVALVVDDLEGPEAQDHDGEQQQHDHPDDVQAHDGREGCSSGEATSDATLTLLRGRIRGWRARAARGARERSLAGLG